MREEFLQQELKRRENWVRVALIADIHGHLLALDAVLADIASHDIDKIVCLGDIALGGPHPHECIQRVRELKCLVVKGNCDQWIVDYHKRDATPDLIRGYAKFGAWVREIDEWSAQVTTNEDADWLEALPMTQLVGLGVAWTLFCAHGSPTSYNQRLTPDMPHDELAAALQELTISGYHAMFAGGHTHLPMARQVQVPYANQPGSYWVTSAVNPGSVGLPILYDDDEVIINPTDYAEYMILQQHVGIALSSLEHRRVPLDPETVRADAIASSMPHADRWRGDWLEA